MSDIDPNAIGVVPPQLGSTNRGYDTRFTEGNSPELTVTLETINDGIMTYLTQIIQPTIIRNDERVEVPVVYGSPERWASITKFGAIRDEHNDRLVTPLIVLRRTEEKRNILNNPSNKYLYTSMTTGWNSRNVYDKFAVLNHVRPSQQIRNVIVPDYIDLTYEVFIWTELQEQMDMLLEQINTEAYEYWGNRNTFKFRVSIDEYQNESTLPSTEDRVIRKVFTMKVGAYLLPERMVKNFKLASTNTNLYTVKKVVTMVEAVSKIE